MNGCVKVKNTLATKKPPQQPISTVSQGVGLNNFSFLKQHLICPPDESMEWK